MWSSQVAPAIDVRFAVSVRDRAAQPWWKSGSAAVEADVDFIDCLGQRSGAGVVIMHLFDAWLRHAVARYPSATFPLAFDAAVYDSCPSLYTRLLPLGAPFVLASSGKPIAEIAVDMVRHVPYAFAWAFAGITNLVALPKPLGLFHRLFTAEDNTPKPELFIYSSADWLIPPSHVESFIESRKAMGISRSSSPERYVVPPFL